MTITKANGTVRITLLTGYLLSKGKQVTFLTSIPHIRETFLFPHRKYLFLRYSTWGNLIVFSSSTGVNQIIHCNGFSVGDPRFQMWATGTYWFYSIGIAKRTKNKFSISFFSFHFFLLKILTLSGVTLEWAFNQKPKSAKLRSGFLCICLCHPFKDVCGRPHVY